MAYCSKCGVEVEKFTTSCPLCGEYIDSKCTEKPDIEYYYPEHIKETPEERQKRIAAGLRIFRDTIHMFLLISVAVVVLSDILRNQAFTYSYQAVAGIFFSYGWLMLLTHVIPGRPILGLGIAGVLTLSFLFFLDYYDSVLQWFVFLGVPIVVMLFLFFLTVILFIKWFKLKGFNVAATISISLAAALFVIELIVQLFHFKVFKLYWSMITAIIFIPLGIIFLFIHTRMKDYHNFKKRFHL